MNRSTDAYFVFGIVEGHGDVNALPALLTKIVGKRLQMGTNVNRLHSGHFLNNKEKREKCFERVRAFAADTLAAGQSGCVLILMDADKMGKDKNCCKVWLNNSNQAAEILADISRIFAEIPSLLVLVDKGYESWLVAGLGGGNPGDPKKWLGENRKLWDEPESKDDIRPSEGYSPRPDQKIATSSPNFNLDLAAKKNRSFKRLRKRLLEMVKSC